MLAARLTKRVSCTVPIQQAGMGSASPPALAAAVSNASGLGMIGTARWGANTVPDVRSLLTPPSRQERRPAGVGAARGSLACR